MARGESLSGLYMRLGLDFSELDENFVQATRTLRSNMASLSRENTIIRLQAEADLSSVEDADERLRIQTESLNRQIQLQQQRLRLATASLTDSARATGEHSDNTQRARIAVERERLALTRLQNELNNVTDSSRNASSSQNTFAGALQEMGTKAAGVLAGLTAVKEGFDFVFDSAEKVRESFSEIQKYSLILAMPMQDTKDFLQLVRMTGSEIDDLEGAVRGVQSALATGDNEDREFVALNNLGLDPFNADGTMKGFKDLLDLMYEGYLRAKDLGKEIEYVLDLGGDAGAKDLLQYFEQLEETTKRQANISKVEMPFEEMHNLDMEMKMLTEQTDEFQKAFGVAFAPLARETVQGLFEVFKAGTDSVKESTAEIQKFGFALDIAGQKLKDFYAERTGGGNLFEDVLGSAEKVLGGIADPLGLLNLNLGKNLFGDIWAEATQKQEEYNQAVEESNKKFEELNEKASTATLNTEATKRLRDYKDQLAELKNELNNWGDDYNQSLGELDKWYSDVLKQTQISEEERTAISELYNAKREKIEREYQEKIAKENEETQNRIKSIMQETADIEYSATHSAFEKQLHDLEQWKVAQMEKAKSAEEVSAIIANAAAKESQAFQEEVDRIKGLTQSLEDEIFAMEHSQAEIDKRSAMQKAQRALNEGVDSATVDRYLKDKFTEIDSRLAKDKEYGKGKNDYQGGAKYIDLTEKAPAEIPLFTDETKIMNRLKSGVQPVKTLADIMPQNDNSGIEIIKGVQSSLDGLKTALQPATSQTIQAQSQPLTTANLQALISDLKNSTFEKDSYGNYGSDDTALNNFINTLQNAGAEWQQISGYLDTVLAKQQMSTAGNMTVSPAININVNGNIIADQKFEVDLAERIKDEVYKGVTSAVESATQNNFSYAS